MSTPLRVLILQDQRADVELMLHELLRAGFILKWQSAKTEADYRRGLDAKPDIILANYQQPQLDALQALRWMLKRGLDIPFVVVSGIVGEDVAVEEMNQGTADYLLKDHLARLGPAVVQALEQRRLRAEKQQAEAALRESEERLRSTMQATEHENLTMNMLLAAIPSILICVNETDQITQWNKAAEGAFGIAAATVLGKPFPECGISWDWAAILERIQACRDQGKPVRMADFRFTHPNGLEGIVSITFNPILMEAGRRPGFLLLGADITERRLLESQLAHAQKMESIGQLAAGIAHEINTPTQYIGDNTRFLKEAFEDLSFLLMGYTELLAASKAGPVSQELVARLETVLKDTDVEYLLDEIPKALQQSLEGIARVTKIVQAMKEFSHPGTEEKVAVDLNRAIESTLTVARNEWKYVAEVHTDFDPALPMVPCLPGDFNQAILNIILNAAHAIADVVGEDSKQKGMITVSTRQKDDWVEIRIADTGTGIPEAVRPRIFDPFFTTKEVGKGTGQGLAIAHSAIVDKHRGTIGFETETGKGTTFVIRLPLGQ